MTSERSGPALRIFLIADIRGYTTFTQDRGDEAAATLAMRFAGIARERLSAAGATGLQFRGDEVLAVFTSARQAIRSAVGLQDAFVEASIADHSFALPVGIGLDAGEAVEVDDGYRGGALNLAARLCSIAGPGEILASEAVVHLARRVEGVAQADRGTARLKGLAQPIRLTLITKEGWDPEKDDDYQLAIGGRGGIGGTEFAVCPYRGLAAFQPEDADRFFGRDDLVAELVERLDRDRVLFVVGPSGSGKSSAVRAGMVPAIRSGAIAGSERWAIALFSPRATPTAELWYQIKRVARGLAIPTDDIADLSSTAGVAQLRAVADAICDVTGGLLIAVDQFEELFTLSPRREQEAFVQLLTSIADPSAGRVRIVMVMRADFYGVCATFPWLAKRATANQVLVGPMSRADLHKVIEEPAATKGYTLEEGLVEAVLEDAGPDAAALPLISHAMAETWRRREGRVLTVAGYRDAGGVAGSIAQTADTLIEAAFGEDEREACRRLMLRLVAPGEGTADTRRRLPLHELDRDPDPAVSLHVAAEMTNARLLTADRDSLEIAHEALLRSWPRLRRWIDEGRDDLRMRQRIANAAAEWASHERDPDLLYRGTPLQAGAEWAAAHEGSLGKVEEAFLGASLEAEREQRARSEQAVRHGRRVRRVAVAALGVLAVAAVAASVIAFSALGESRARFAQALATQARLLAGSDPRTAIALAAESSARAGTVPVDARAAMVDAALALAAPFVLSGPPIPVGDASTVAVSPDGSFIATGNRDGTISTWAPTGAALSTDVPGHSLAIEEMDFTPDGRWLVSGSDDTTVMLWDVADPAHIPAPTVLGRTTGYVWSVAVSPDGRLAASASEDGTIRLWDLANHRQQGAVVADLAFDALTVAFSPDGKLLLVGDGRGDITGWSVEDRRVVVPTFSAHRSDVWEIEFDRDGSRFATASSDGRVRVWDTNTLKMISEPFERSAYDVRGALLIGGEVVGGDEQGRLLVAPIDRSARPTATAPGAAQIVDASWGGGMLATLGFDQRMQLWSKGDEPMAKVIGGQPDGAFGLAASPDGSRLAVGDGDGNVTVFAADSGEAQVGPIHLHGGRVGALAFSDDGTKIASGGEDGTVTVVDAATGESVAGPSISGAEITDVLWDGDLLVAGDAGGTVSLWRGSGSQGDLTPLTQGEATPTTQAITDMALSSDGTLAVADELGTVRLWDLGDRRQLGEPIAAGDGNTISGVAWSADGATLATASADEQVTLWDAASREAKGTLTPQPGGALSVAFLSDGATIVTTSGYGAVRLWDAAEMVALGGVLPGHEGNVGRSVALPDMRFVTSSEDGSVRIWDVLDAERACERAAGTLGPPALSHFLGGDQAPTACG